MARRRRLSLAPIGSESFNIARGSPISVRSATETRLCFIASMAWLKAKAVFSEA